MHRKGRVELSPTSCTYFDKEEQRYAIRRDCDYFYVKLLSKNKTIR